MSNNGKFSVEFIIEKPLGEGKSGEVFKVINKIDNKIYAVKKVLVDSINHREAFDREVNILLNKGLNCEYVVKIYDQWTEPNFAYIQMEFCNNDLKSLLETKAKHFGRTEQDKMNLFEYFISFEMLRELTECLNHLHSQKPPIMHRDLKPANVLITNGINGRFLKLCDFGISVIHEKSSHSRQEGTIGYIAPEVPLSRKYNIKADIYSLGIIAQQFFQTELKHEWDLNGFDTIFKNSEKISQIISDMSLEDPDERPKCPIILEKYKEINFSRHLIEKYIRTHQLNDGNNIDDFFYNYYIKHIQTLNYFK